MKTFKKTLKGRLLAEQIQQVQAQHGQSITVTDFRQFLQGVPQARRAGTNVVYLQFTPQDVYAEQSVFLKHDFNFDPGHLEGNSAGQGNVALEAHPEYDPHNPAHNATAETLIADIQAMEDHFN